jgi:DNA mismatch repair ATPase MutL
MESEASNGTHKPAKQVRVDTFFRRVASPSRDGGAGPAGDGGAVPAGDGAAGHTDVEADKENTAFGESINEAGGRKNGVNPIVDGEPPDIDPRLDNCVDTGKSYSVKNAGDDKTTSVHSDVLEHFESSCADYSHDISDNKQKKMVLTASTIIMDTDNLESQHPSRPLVIFDDFSSLSQTTCKTIEVSSQSGDSGAKPRIVFDDFSSHCPSSLTYSGSTGMVPAHGSSQRLQEHTESDVIESRQNLPRQEDDIGESLQSLPHQEPASVKITFIDGGEPRSCKKKSVNLDFSMFKLKDSAEALKIQTSKPAEEMRFSARISPEDNSSAEAELDRQLSKSDFAAMDIYGQFNLGFLIVGLRQDLFIIDQHATDEKYNFEKLQESTVISSQRMVQPQRLELTAVGESIVMEHLPVFQRNGFQFLVEPDRPPTQRVSLTHLPTRDVGNL